MDDGTRDQIARLRAEGNSWRVIARRLEADAVPTSSGAGAWHGNTCRRAVEPYRSAYNRYMAQLRRK